MLSSLHLNPFKIYNIFLFVIFSVVVNNNLPSLFSICFYSFFYLILIYLGIFYYKKYLLIVYFIYGLLLDILLLNEIGPHLLVFALTFLLLTFSIKHFYNLSGIKIYLFIIFLQIFMIFLQMTIGYYLFNINFNFTYFIQMIFITLILSYPIFLLFFKIDRIK